MKRLLVSNKQTHEDISNQGSWLGVWCLVKSTYGERTRRIPRYINIVCEFLSKMEAQKLKWPGTSCERVIESLVESWKLYRRRGRNSISFADIHRLPYGRSVLRLSKVWPRNERYKISSCLPFTPFLPLSNPFRTFWMTRGDKFVSPWNSLIVSNFFARFTHGD